MTIKIHKAELRDIAIASFGLIGALWVILLLSQILPLQSLGIRPRSIPGLIGIPFSPFLHANAAHLAANTMALLVLGWLLFVLEGPRMFFITGVIVIFGGLGTWLIGRGDSIHLGASGVIYGMFGYILAAGWYKRSPASIVAAVAVALFYGGMIWGVMPRDPNVSWEGHLCGMLAGIGDAKFRWEKGSMTATKA